MRVTERDIVQVMCQFRPLILGGHHGIKLVVEVSLTSSPVLSWGICPPVSFSLSHTVLFLWASATCLWVGRCMFAPHIHSELN